MDSSPDSLNGLPISETIDSPPLSTIYNDVNVVPEHQKIELEQSIINLEGQIHDLKLQNKSLNEKRSQALNKIIDTKGSIRVFCRIRPLLSSDKKIICKPILIQGEESIVVRSSGGSKKHFGFDKVLRQESTQEDVFLEIKPILRSALDGHNVCVMAYGQTCTGKTFTMDGTTDQPGIVPRALEEIFRSASLDDSCLVTFSMSMLEVYLGNPRDLLAPKSVFRSYEAATRCNLNIRTDANGYIEIEGLTEIQIPNLTKARFWYNKGKRVRSTSLTNINDASSRSHCLTRITIVRTGKVLGAKPNISKLWIIDLGGSERLFKTGAIGQTMDEGRAMNLSLSALGDVISALRKKNGHVPYRNSKLTQILKDSLGTGSKVVMLVHISPCKEDLGETICSLNFTKRVRAVDSNRELTEDLKKQKDKIIAELEAEMREAEEESAKTTEQLGKAELLLSQNKKLYSETYCFLGTQEIDQKSLEEEESKEVIAAPTKSDRTVKQNISSLTPRFMTSTVASRQRQSYSEKARKTKTLRSVTFQSLSLSSDQRFRDILRSSNGKSKLESPKCNDYNMRRPSLTRTKMVTSSDPNLRVTLCNHRRRMSDFI